MIELIKGKNYEEHELSEAVLTAESELIDAIINWYWKWEAKKVRMTEEDREDFDICMYDDNKYVEPFVIMTSVISLAHETGADPDDIIDLLGSMNMGKLEKIFNSGVDMLNNSGIDMLNKKEEEEDDENDILS